MAGWADGAMIPFVAEQGLAEIGAVRDAACLRSGGQFSGVKVRALRSVLEADVFQAPLVHAPQVS